MLYIIKNCKATETAKHMCKMCMSDWLPPGTMRQRVHSQEVVQRTKQVYLV